MAITASSSTAFDVPTLVSQLMSVERKPIDKLNAKIASNETKISSLGTLNSLVATFQAAAKSLDIGLQKFAATPSDASVFSATVGSTAVPGTYALNVSQLAQSQNLVAAGRTSSIAAIGDGTTTTVAFDFGTTNGTTFTPNGSGTKSITIDGTNNSLAGIRDAINSAAVGVSATLVNDGSGTPFRLALTSVSSGVSNSLKITTSRVDGTIDNTLGGGIDGLLGYDPAGAKNLTQTLAAQNGNFTVNGIAITSASNTVSEAIEGVTLTLKNTTATTVNFTVMRDTAAINTAASSFVDAYNALASQIKSRSAYGTDGKGAGALAGDGTLRLMQDQLRGIFNTPASGGTLTSLNQVGISIQKDGSLLLEGNKLDSAIAANFSDVRNLFSSSTGFATRLEAWAKSSLGAGGLFDVRSQSLNKSIKEQNQSIDRLENRLSAVQKRLTRQYTDLNLMLSRMNSTSTFLTNQLSSRQN